MNKMKTEIRDTRYEVRSANKKNFFNRHVLPVSYFVLITILLFFAVVGNSSCNIYKFRDVSIPDSIKTVKVNFIENRAPYVNPQLSPRLTDKIRQKIVSQTRLSQTNNDNADWDIKGHISNYSFSTTGLTTTQGGNRQQTTNRLTVTVHIILNDQKANKTQEYDVSRNFEFSANQSIQQAEAGLGDEIIRGLTDDIFNRIFSNW